MLDDDIEGTREERSFRMWINSLNIEGVYVHNLYEEVKDGLTLIKILEKLDPSNIQWN
jgi:plastin-1